jgi:actin-related protein 9
LICEILPPGTPLPGTGAAQEKDIISNPAAAASTGAISSGPTGAATIGNGPRGPGIDTEVGEDTANDENEGVLDVASIVAGGKMNEYLAKKEKEKQEKALAKKKGAPAPEAANRQVRLPNAKREKATFLYEDHALLDTLKNMDLGTQGLADAKSALNEVTGKQAQEHGENGEPRSAVEANGTGEGGSRIRREIEVGTERFQADSDGTLEKIAAAVHRAISSVDEVQKRSDLWDNLIICGNGSRLRGQCIILHISTRLTQSQASKTHWSRR